MSHFDIPRTDFGIETETFFKNLPYNEQKEVLHFHQYIINKFMVDKKRRGLLMFHSMGFGKTILAVSITEAYRKLDPTRKAIILLPRSLQNNFSDTVRSYMKSAAAKSDTATADNAAADQDSETAVEDHYKFVSLNSSNMYSQIGRLDKTSEELEFEKNLGLLTDKIGDGSLENSVLVIDEFHNLSNAITNGSKNGLSLYNKIMKTKDIKLIFLTGTPLINNPFELVCVMNMLKGKQLFPENVRDFLSFFVDYENYKIKNKERFQNRIIGLVSYYGDEYFEGQKPGFPIELPMKIEHIPMSKEQFARYLEAREIEKKEEARKFSKPQGDNTQFKQKGSASSSYRIRSRQISNFLIPPDALTYKGDKITEKDISKIPTSTYKNLDIYSPKNKKILENVNKHKGQLQLVFSQFTTAEGLGVFGKVLEAHGFVEWKTDDTDEIKLRKPNRTKKVSTKKANAKLAKKSDITIRKSENEPKQLTMEEDKLKSKSESENDSDSSNSNDSSDNDSDKVEGSGFDKYEDYRRGGRSGNRFGGDDDMGAFSDNDALSDGIHSDNPHYESTAEHSGAEYSGAEHSGAEHSGAEHSHSEVFEDEPNLPNHKLRKYGGAKSRSKVNGRGPQRKFAIYSGDVLPSIRNRLVEIFNSKENMHGEIIEVLLISNQTGGLGLDLHGVRAIHIMEPFWNWALILQIIARGVRYNSHKDFPKAEQNVQPYMYLSVFPKSYTPMSKDEDSKVTTDMHLYTEARNNRKLNESFLMALIEASIDCSIHHKRLSQSIQKKIHCYLCAPTGELLYNTDFYKDMAPDAYNPCKQYTAKKIETKELLYTPPDGSEPQKFYYNAENKKDIKIYEYNQRLEGYTPLKPSHPFYSDIMRVILNI